MTKAKEESGKQTCWLGDRTLISGLGKNSVEMTFKPRPEDVPSSSVIKHLPANAGDAGLITGSGRSPGGGHGNPLQYSCLDSLFCFRFRFAVSPVRFFKDSTSKDHKRALPHCTRVSLKGITAIVFMLILRFGVWGCWVLFNPG